MITYEKMLKISLRLNPLCLCVMDVIPSSTLKLGKVTYKFNIVVEAIKLKASSSTDFILRYTESASFLNESLIVCIE